MDDFSQNKKDVGTLEAFGTKQVFLDEATRTQGQILVAEITISHGTGISPHKHTLKNPRSPRQSTSTG